MNIEKREIAWKGLTLRSADDSGTSTVEGVAVPFGDIIDTWDGAETFDRECEFQGLDEAKLCFEHGETIGRITKAESTDDGLHITARISDTARGRDAMTLIRDGVLDSFSVGFIPLESQKDRDGITHRRKVRLLETSIVSWPAYQNAKMTKSAAPAVEQRKETMENNNELMDLIQSMQEEQRGIKAEISKMGAKPAPAAIGAAYRCKEMHRSGAWILAFISRTVRRIRKDEKCAVLTNRKTGRPNYTMGEAHAQVALQCERLYKYFDKIKFLCYDGIGSNRYKFIVWMNVSTNCHSS